MKCTYFEQGKCLSCEHIQLPLVQQLEQKSQRLTELMSNYPVEEWLPPVSGKAQAFRNKAKMVVLGAAHAPILGLLGPNNEPISLCDCNLYPQDMQLLLHRLETFIREAGIPPYNVDKDKGELKFILLTRSQFSGEFLLRFVLRSTKSLVRIEKNLSVLLTNYPSIKVVSVNIQPIRMAILEGEEEIFLTEATRLEENFNDVPLFIRPKSFFQTNPEIAAKLYQTARVWVNELKPQSVWDLFCGVGGFGLHLANSSIKLTGIEIESEAIACAKLSAQKMGLTQVEFTALDSIDFAKGQSASEKPDLVIVNPPRRGIGQSLSLSLNQFSPKAILYSSCNPQSLAADLAELSTYRIVKIQLFDMFPHTEHFEVLALLIRKG